MECSMVVKPESFSCTNCYDYVTFKENDNKTLITLAFDQENVGMIADIIDSLKEIERDMSLS